MIRFQCATARQQHGMWVAFKRLGFRLMFCETVSDSAGNIEARFITAWAF